jgi:hypothetical protein
MKNPLGCHRHVPCPEINSPFFFSLRLLYQDLVLKEISPQEYELGLTLLAEEHNRRLYLL